MIDASKWTGASLPRTSALDLLRRVRPAVERDGEVLAPAPRREQPALEEYAQLSKAIGYVHPHVNADLAVEDFKAFLRLKGWTVFNLAAVTVYMDKKAADESAAKAGWHWRPLRAKDDITDATFGRAAYQHHQMPAPNPASDHYRGPRSENQMQWSNGGRRHESTPVKVPSSGAPYDKLVPIHALRKVAAIEAEYKKPVSFFVCDYAPAPHIEHPDPFLMVVINNARLDKGYGRFVIDFWDEPGFGLEQQLVAP